MKEELKVGDWVRKVSTLMADHHNSSYEEELASIGRVGRIIRKQKFGLFEVSNITYHQDTKELIKLEKVEVFLLKLAQLKDEI